ncbi:MAG: glycerol-3-phosphate dehydrogenase/oxidase, partial [Chloroflexales bacterium]|nr:glycerol-3-phosphate dehydrogenase/oxidase [Chloroflexales bacterium]
VVVGAGATGLGVAVDAAARGYKTLLLEAYDFSKGTSSRSTKLVHGGVRYLAQGNISLVRDALRERGLMHRNAPHLVRALAFVIPLYKWWQGGWYGAGLRVYDLLAGKLGIGSSKIVGFGEAIQRVPTLARNGLLGGVVYYDGQFDDSRLAITLLRTFLDNNGTALNYMRVTGLNKTNGRVSGVQAQDTETGAEYAIPARVVVNATGVYADEIRTMDDTQAPSMLSPSQGVHLVLDKSFLPGDSAIMIPKTDDGRVLFIIPWHDRAVVGTTDTAVKHAPIEPRALPDEVDFLLSHTSRYLNKQVTPSDVLSIFAGLRPLVKAGGDGKSTAALSRDHTLLVSDSGLVTITGGKWTTYRKMSEDTVEQAIEVGQLPQRPCLTKELKLHGWTETPESEPFKVYGADAAAVKQVLAEQPDWGERLHPNLPYRVGEVVWAARYELARTVEDVLARRLRSLLLDARASIEVAPKVAALLAAELGFDEGWQQDQVQQYSELANGYLLVPATASQAAVMT